MAKISLWHFRHLLLVVWLKRGCKREGHGHPRTPPWLRPWNWNLILQQKYERKLLLILVRLQHKQFCYNCYRRGRVGYPSFPWAGNSSLSFYRLRTENKLNFNLLVGDQIQITREIKKHTDQNGPKKIWNLAHQRQDNININEIKVLSSCFLWGQPQNNNKIFPLKT